MTSVIKCCFQLIRRELYLFFKRFLNRFIDISFVLFTSVAVFGYLMLNSGLESSYGAFILVGCIASFGLFETIQRATCLAQDVTDNKIDNFLILPISSYFVFVSIAISWAISTSVLTLCLFPLGKLLLWGRFDLSNASWGKFTIIFIASNLFYGFFALWVSALVTNLRNTSWLWCRLINPLYMFCGFFYTWNSVYELSHFAGYLHLANPLIYILEATKASIFGQSGYLPFWWCFAALWAFIAVFAFDAIRRFKKRVDFV
jgi:ABC-type polysaccharide/polyol phosphate export permease